MDKTVAKAYDALVPADQLVVDAVIATLYTKDRQITDLVKHISKELDKEIDIFEGVQNNNGPAPPASERPDPPPAPPEPPK